MGLRTKGILFCGVSSINFVGYSSVKIRCESELCANSDYAFRPVHLF